jgi:hypothetical protein
LVDPGDNVVTGYGAIPHGDIRVKYFIGDTEIPYNSNTTDLSNALYFPLTNRLALGPHHVTVQFQYTGTDPAIQADAVFEDGNYYFRSYFTIRVYASSAGLDPIIFWLSRTDEAWDPWTAINGAPNGSTIVIIVAFNRHDLSVGNLNGDNKTVMFVAFEPNTILGRDGNFSFPIYGNNNTIMFGTWEFAEDLVIAFPITTHPMIVNAGNSSSVDVGDFNSPVAPTSTSTTPMFQVNNAANTFRIVVGGDATVLNRFSNAAGNLGDDLLGGPATTNYTYEEQ